MTMNFLCAYFCLYIIFIVVFSSLLLRKYFSQVALSAIVRKVHLLEVCQKLYEDTKALLLHLPPLDDDNRIKEEVMFCLFISTM